MTQTLPFRLSTTATKQVNWNAIQDSTVGIADRSLEEVSTSAVSSDQVRRVFSTARREFGKALDSLRRLMRILLVIVGLSAVVAIAGVLVATVWKSLTSGVVLSTVGVASLLGFFGRVYQLGRDQAMLELLPMRYEMALEMASTPEDRRKVLDDFLRETTSLRVAN